MYEYKLSWVSPEISQYETSPEQTFLSAAYSVRSYMHALLT